MCRRVVTTPSARRRLRICCGSSCEQDRQGAEVSVFSQALHSFFIQSTMHWLVHPREIRVPMSDTVLGIRKLLLADPNRQRAVCAGLPVRFAGWWSQPLWGQSCFSPLCTPQEGIFPILPTWEFSHIIQNQNFLTQWRFLRNCALCQHWNIGLVCCTKHRFGSTVKLYMCIHPSSVQDCVFMQLYVCFHLFIHKNKQWGSLWSFSVSKTKSRWKISLDFIYINTIKSQYIHHFSSKRKTQLSVSLCTCGAKILGH